MIPRVLLVSEYSGLSTGYSVYSRNLLKGLAESNKYIVAEMASYAHNTEYDLPWKVYGYLPRNEEEAQEYNSHGENVFGRHVFEKVCLDFKPTHILEFCDPWYRRYILDSPYRKCFNFIWSPTVDSVQQNKEWLEWYSDADALLSYTDFSVDVLKNEGRLLSRGEAPMSCSEYFVPMNKDEVKKSFGVNPEIKIVGFVGRNQKRKLYPELLETFRAYLDKTKRDDVVLWIHTAYPDLCGWDFPKLMQKYNLGSRLWMTYFCKCGAKPMPFSGARHFCQKCGWQMQTSNVGGGIPDYEMARIFNAFDYYIQYATCEGFGSPQVEAAACGVHGASVNYSAMEDISSKLGWDKIKFEQIEEIETGRLMAVPNREDLLDKMENFLSLPATFRNLAGQKARQNYVKNYSWTKNVEKWMSVIDSLPIKGYTQPDIMNPEPLENGVNLPSGKFVKWLILRVLGRPEKLGTIWEYSMISDLNTGYRDRTEFNKKNAYDMCLGMRQRINYWESKRGTQY